MKITKPWGWEKTWINNELYCHKIMHCEDNIWSSSGLYHMHVEKDETFLVAIGILELDVDGEVFLLGPGEQKRIKPLTPHRFRGEDCVFGEISTPDKSEDSIRGTLEDLRDRSRQYRESPYSYSAKSFWH